MAPRRSPAKEPSSAADRASAPKSARCRPLRRPFRQRPAETRPPRAAGREAASRAAARARPSRTPDVRQPDALTSQAVRAASVQAAPFRPKRARAKAAEVVRKPAPVAPPKLSRSPPAPDATVQTVTVTPDENGMRVDRFLEARFPGLSFSHIQRVIRKGQLRVNGKRVEPKDRLEAGQSVRIPPLRLDPEKPRGEARARTPRPAPSWNPSRCTTTTT